MTKEDIKDCFKLFNLFIPWTVWVGILLAILVTMPIGYHHDYQIALERQQIEIAAHQAMMSIYLGQAKDFALLDKGHYTVIERLPDFPGNMAILKYNIPTGDIIILAQDLPLSLQPGQYYSKQT